MVGADGVATTLLGQWGPAGAIIVGLAAAMVAGVRHFTGQIDKMMADDKAERAEMRQAHAAERAELQRINQQNFDHSVAVSRENTASNRAVEQVLRDLTGVIGEIRAQTRSR